MSKKNSAKSQSTIATAITGSELGLSELHRPASSVGFSTYVRALMQNWRQGTVACKTRAEVAKSNKKPWKQKGTGRARAGSARSPLWRGGGIIFGPQPRTRVLDVGRKVKQRAFGDLLRGYLNSDRVLCLDWAIEGDAPKTSAAFNALQLAQLQNKKINIFVPANDFKTQASFANIPSVRLILFDQANAFDLANCDYWVFLKKDIDEFKGMVSKWI